MSRAPTVGVVLVNYNGARFLSGCVDALLRGTYRNIMPVVVDNASSDDSIARLAREHPGIALRRLPTNRGITGGNNEGIGHCLALGCEYVLLLNFDTLPAPDLVERLVEAADDRTLVSALTCTWDDAGVTNVHAGGFDWRLGRLREWYFGQPITALARPLTEVEVADTCCLLVPAVVFDRIGWMDEAYFMYYDDTDFVVRARRAGFRVVLHRDARLRHFERGSTGTFAPSPAHVYYTTRNRLYFMRKHCPRRRQRAAFLGWFALTRAAHWTRFAWRREWRHLYWAIRAVHDGVIGRLGGADSSLVNPA